jgi:multidrug efflux pump subunit AcrB
MPIFFSLLAFVLLPTILFVVRLIMKGISWFFRNVLDRANELTTRGLHIFIHRFYRPILTYSLHNPAIVFAAAASMLLLAIGLFEAGVVKFNYFPKMDANRIYVAVTFPDGTPAAVTNKATEELEKSIRKIAAKYEPDGKSIFKAVERTVGQARGDGVVASAQGSHYGAVQIELVDPSERNIDGMTLVNEWRAASGKYPGVERLEFAVEAGGPPGKPIEFSLLATPENMDKLEEAAEECKAELAKYEGVFDIFDNSQPGKWEYQINVKDEAKAMGNTTEDLAQTVRGSYYGHEVMRLQRGRHEVKLMVRYPRGERRSLSNFDDIRVRTSPTFAQMLQGTTKAAELPLSELADINVERSYSEINRIDQLRSITVTSDLDERISNAREIVAKMKQNFFPELLEKYPELQLRWEGQQEQTGESINGLIIGLVVAILAMFGLLTFEFRSYIQPFLILSVIPFGAIGALLGHLVLGIDMTILSLFGLVALTGVVVNDSIVLIDFMNHRVRSGLPLIEALIDASCRRFRPVMLTSLTTVAGLSPIMLERSLQAQFVIPMAASLCFGLMFATLLILILVPTVYLVYAKMARLEEKAPTESADFLRMDE